MPNPSRGAAFVLVAGLLLLLFLGPSLMREAHEEVPYSEFLTQVQEGRVQSVTLSSSSLLATYRDGEVRRTVILPNDTSLVRLLHERGVLVDYDVQPARPWWSTLLTSLFPVGLLIGFLWFMTRQQGQGGGQGQVFQFGQSRAKLQPPSDKKVTMQDVAGLTEVKEELQEVVDFLKHPERYRELGARIPKGVLLSGPPGTGKTLLARAVAGEAGVPFLSISGSDFVELFAGVGAARVRDTFEKAKQRAPCIVFIDEIDAVGRHRGIGVGGSNDEREQTLNQLLVEMDGFGANEGIIILAATNRIDVLDPALLRAGRFDRQIVVDVPDRQGRREILAVHAVNKPMADDVDLDSIAARTVGFTGADLANLLNEAALVAARRRQTQVHMAEIDAAYDRIIAGGPSRKRMMNEKERERVAYHEAGHAIVALRLPGSDPVRKVTIVGAGSALGYVQYQPKADKHLHTRSDIANRIVGLLGGRAAEEIALGDISTGAGNDLERATSLARRMVTELGMDDELGPVRLGTPEPEHPLFGTPISRTLSEETAHAVDQAVRRMVVEGHERATQLILHNRAALEKIARTLLERETISGEELEGLVAPVT